MSSLYSQNNTAINLIMIVDTVPASIKQLQASIEVQYPVITLNSSNQAIEYLKLSDRPWPTIILIAWQLFPPNSLDELIRYDIPIIVQGNQAPDAERLTALFAQGVLDYWQLPLPSVVVQQRLQQILRSKAQEHQLASRNRDLDVLTKLSKDMSQIRQLDQILKRLLAELWPTLPLKIGLIFIVSPDEQAIRLEAKSGLPPEDQSIAHYQAIASNSDLAGQTAFEQRTITSANGWISIPLLSMARVVGVIQFQMACEQTIEAETFFLLEAIATRIAEDIENRLFQAEIQRTHHEAVELYHANRRINQAANLEMVYQEIFNYVSGNGADYGMVWLFDQFHRYGDPPPQQTKVASIWQKNCSLNQGEKGTFNLARTGILHRLKRTEPLLLNKNEIDIDLNQALPAFFQDQSQKGYLAFIPMLAQDTWVGIVLLGNISGDPAPFSPEILRSYWVLVSQAAMVIMNLRLLQDAQRQTSELQVLNQMSQAFVSTLNPQEVLQAIIEQVGSILPIDACSVFLVEKSSGDLLFEVSLEPEGIPEAVRRLPKGCGIAGWVVEHQQPQNVANASQDERYYAKIGQATDLIAGSIICAPIIRSNTVIGAIQGINAKTDAFREEDLQLLVAAANHAAVALDNAQLHKETLQRLAELSLLQIASVQLASTIELNDLLALVIATAKMIISVDMGNILLLKKDNPLEAHVFIPEAKNNIELATTTLHPHSLTYQILEAGTITIITDRRMIDFSIAHNLPKDWCTLIGVPLQINNQSRGILYLSSLEARQFAKYELTLLETFVNQATLAIDHARLYQETSTNLKRISILYEIAQTARYFHNRPQVLNLIISAIRRYFSANPVMIFTLSKVDADTLEPYYTPNVPAAKLLNYRKTPWRLSESCFQPLIQGKRIHIDHLQASQHETFRSRLLYPDAASWHAASLQIEDRVVGIIVLISQEPNLLSEEEAQFLYTIAGHIAVVLENMFLVNELETQTKTLAQTNQELRAANDVKSRFLATMSHELRTPLNSILGYGEILQDELEGPLTSNQADAVERVVRNGRNLLLLIEDILDLSKMDADMLSMQFDTFFLYRAIDEALDVVLPLANQKGLSLTVEALDDDTQVYADFNRVRQVLVNLLSNAVKFTPAGQVILKVKAIDPDQVFISIRDTGIGIPPAELDRLFVEFYQVDNGTTREYGGTGLGLTITKRLLKLMGGDIKVESEVGRGSTFTFDLPCSINQSDYEEIHDSR